LSEKTQGKRRLPRPVPTWAKKLSRHPISCNNLHNAWLSANPPLTDRLRYGTICKRCEMWLTARRDAAEQRKERERLLGPSKKRPGHLR
jgi:hypothetical protein